MHASAKWIKICSKSRACQIPHVKIRRKIARTEKKSHKTSVFIPKFCLLTHPPHFFVNQKTTFSIWLKFYLKGFCHTAREVKELREFSKNVINRIGHRTSLFLDNRQKKKIWRFFLWSLTVAMVTAITSQSALRYCPTKKSVTFS